MSIIAFSRLEREELQKGTNLKVNIDPVKAAVASLVDDAREWDMVYMNILVVSKALQTLGNYTKSLPNKGKAFIWKIPSTPRVLRVGTTTTYVDLTAFPERFNDSCKRIWDRSRKDIKLVVEVLNKAGAEALGIYAIDIQSINEHFYVLTWKNAANAMENVIYLHK